MTQTYHLAQLNIGRMVAPTDDPQVKDFMDNLDKINAIADTAPGFVWRLQTEGGNATDIHVFDNPLLLVNMSVWKDVESLKAYTYKTEHVDFIRRRKEWFVPMDTPHMVLWWVPAGHIPTTDEAKEKLAHLEEFGETAVSFTFRKPFPPPESGADA